MKIAVIGLGYVGATSAACLAHLGHTVTGVDLSEDKVALINSGKSPILEPGLEELIAGETSAGRLSASTSLEESLAGAEAAFVCVGTPSADDGSISLVQAIRVMEQIGEIIKARGDDQYLSIVMRSTVLPGKARSELIPAVERTSGKPMGQGWGFAQNPEFLRESTSIADFLEPAVTVFGAGDAVTEQRLRELYAEIDAPLIAVSIDESALVKYANNAFHALKVAFANEIGVYGKALGIDARKVMEVVCADNKLNISPVYLRPGFAFGGSCLPKDLKAITADGKRRELPLPVLQGTLASNDAVIRQAAERILANNPKTVLLVGISFKDDTDDLRESPMAYLAAHLLKAGVDLRIFDSAVTVEHLVGTNKLFGDAVFDNLEQRLTRDLEAAWAEADSIILAKRFPETRPLLVAEDSSRMILDLNDIASGSSTPKGYDGLWW
ncbi:MAG: nucleotide sugar dehydrogenase [Gammaproteobacteria bacterium]